MNLTKIARAVVVALAAARLTRFVTSDTLGEWLLVGRVKRWAFRREAPGEFANISDDPMPTPAAGWGWRSKLASGLDCPFCAGFWIGALVLLGEATVARLPIIGPLWRLGVAALALNYAVGHVSKRIDQ